jgi:hypothetical protein
MESLLVAVTVISLGLAVTMSAVAWALIRAERQRSAARIEALEALAFSGESGRSEIGVEMTSGPVTIGLPKPPASDSEASPDAVTPPSTGEARQPHLPDWDAAIRSHSTESDNRLERALPKSGGRSVLSASMFDTDDTSTAGTRRLLAVAAIGLLIAAGYATASAMRGPQLTGTVSTASPDAEPQPLELLSLRHATDANGAFAITGFVQNPPDGRDLTNVEAVIYLFDDKDQYFTTGRAPLETADMRPGTDSSFEVHVPNATNVSRYRVGFRQADGTVVTHVDRRGHFPEGSTETVLGGDQVRPAGVLR